MTFSASTIKGELGSDTSYIKVFQDFFIDIDLPSTLTQGDEISIPVSIYNYLQNDQEIKLVLEEENWFEIIGEKEIHKKLKGNEISVEYFPIRVNELGTNFITVKAYGEKKSDAIRRKVLVLPDGKKFEEIISDNLERNSIKKISFPENSIKGANSLVLKLFPGAFSQVVEGLENLLRMPFGCFEQTSSITYPNILILKYLRQRKQAKPELEIKAEEYIGLGLQRLLSYEVAGGGFSWFGNAPANKILTAYGLMEFKDMSEVYELDDKIIPKCVQWLKSKQNNDGSWSPDEIYLHEESWGQIQHSEILPTAYILWALAEAGEKDKSIKLGIEYLQKNLKNIKDAYVLAIVANAFVAIEPDSDETEEVLKTLVNMGEEEDGSYFWSSQSPSITFSLGKSADIETTGLATYALIKSGKFPDIRNKALNYLIRSKDPRGGWWTTQGTVICLRAIVEAEKSSQKKIDALVSVFSNSEKVAEIKIDPTNSDVVRVIEINKNLMDENEIEIKLEGKGSLFYELVSSYYIPWKDLPPPPTPEFSINLDYEKEGLYVNDIAQVNVSVELLKKGEAKMVMVDLGIPPGFEILTPSLDDDVGRAFQKYNITPRQIIIYFEKISFQKPITFSYMIKAKYPVKAKTPISKVYEYYNIHKEVISKPIKIEVLSKN